MRERRSLFQRSTLADLSADVNLLHVRVKGLRGQIPQATNVIALFVGSIVGSEIFKHQGFGVTLYVAGGISCLIALGGSLYQELYYYNLSNHSH